MVKLDNTTAHESRVQRDNVVGEFCHVPIVTLDELGVEADELRDLNNRLRFSSGISAPAEVLPGEEICPDGIVRRSTAAEVIGYDTYHNQVAIEEGTTRAGLGLARLASLAGKMVHYRPNRDVNPMTEYALIYEEAA